MAHSLTQRGVLLVGEELTEGTALACVVATGCSRTSIIAANTAAGGFNQTGNYWSNRKYSMADSTTWALITAFNATTGTFTLASPGVSTSPASGASLSLRVAILSAPLDNVAHGREFLERNITRKTLSADPGIVGGTQPTFGFACEIRGGNTAGNYAEWHTPLEACGFVVDSATASGVQYRPVSTAASQKSMCADIYLDGTKWTFLGCKGSFSTDGVEVNKIGMLSFDMQGLSVTTTAAAIPSNLPAYYGASLPPVINTTDFEFPEGTNLDISSHSLKVENSITRVQATNATSGTRGLIITDRKVTHSLNPEAIDNTYLADLGNNTIRALAFTIGTVAGNKMKFRSPKVQLRTVSPADDGGLRRWSLEGTAHLSAAAGDDELTIKVF